MDSTATSSIFRTEIPLWLDSAPGSDGLELTQKITERSTNPLLHQRVISGVKKPGIIPFFPQEERNNGTAAVVCPGGAYSFTSFDIEGCDIAQWLNSMGVTAFVLKYRLPAEGHQQRSYVPLQDGQRAMRLIRSHAAEWGLDPGKIGAIGFSAGGHLASTLATQHAKVVYARYDNADDLSARPDFLMLGYPVITMKRGITDPGTRLRLIGGAPGERKINEFSNELHVSTDTPPTFIVQANDDSVSALNGTLFYDALKAARVDAEMHIFREGGHGYGIRKARGSLRLWTTLASEWLASCGLIDRVPQE
ncbi:alpha/beta hydrolase [Streptomyces sp. NPDC048110]|uniref:alpha/beta hydrolase n=1 Tax=Streptomyces sp. NPDC048110 TaxID=3155483 RepID=UPI0033E3700D